MNPLTNRKGYLHD